MNIEELTFSFSAMQWLMMGAIGLYAWFIGKLSASAKDMTELRLRVTTMEETLKHVPSSQEFTELSGQIKKIEAEISGSQRELTSISTTVNRISSFLLNNK